VRPRHKAANWVGPGRGRKSTRPGANGVVELSPFEFFGPVRRSRPTTAKTPAPVARGVRTESPAAESRHVAGDREHWQARRGRVRRACFQRAVDQRLLRFTRQAPLARYLADCLGDSSACTAAMLACLADPERANSMAIEAQRRCTGRRERGLALYVACYEDTLRGATETRRSDVSLC
jgi:hypothetical protein